MANEEHVKKLREGTVAWNQWREQNPEIRPNLRGAYIQMGGPRIRIVDNSRGAHHITYPMSVNLSGAYLEWADLSGAYLSEADLSRAYLSKANLSRAYLSKANLSRADLRGADLSGAHLNGADLHGAHLDGAYLSGADLHGAHLGSTHLSRANLRRADLSGAYLSGADLHGAHLDGADLSGADLSETHCVHTYFTGASLTECMVYGISAWDVDLKGAKQTDLRITPMGTDAAITVDNLEVAQFLYTLLHNEKARALLDTITSKVVLILGRFAERKLILDALREALRHHPNGYIPVLFDFDPQKDKPVLETVKLLANLARFVIADLTDPHMVRAELTAILPNVPSVPVKPIIEGDAELPTEYSSWVLYRSFLPLYRYADLSQLLASLKEFVIAPVEKHVQARRLADADVE